MPFSCSLHGVLPPRVHFAGVLRPCAGTRLDAVQLGGLLVAVPPSLLSPFPWPPLPPAWPNMGNSSCSLFLDRSIRRMLPAAFAAAAEPRLRASLSLCRSPRHLCGLPLAKSRPSRSAFRHYGSHPEPLTADPGAHESTAKICVCGCVGLWVCGCVCELFFFG